MSADAYQRNMSRPISSHDVIMTPVVEKKITGEICLRWLYVVCGKGQLDWNERGHKNHACDTLDDSPSVSHSLGDYILAYNGK